MGFEIKKATRQGIKPLVVVYSESGCGKTFSALLVGRGIAGPAGKMVMVDSESGRGSLYADIAELGGYDVLELTKFSPSDYIDAIDKVEASGADVGILDSGSHEWEGISGVLDMAAANEASSNKPGLHNWRIPKLEHQKFVQRLLRSKIPWIVCLRAKYKTRQAKENGKTVIIKDDVTSPIQAEDFIFEATCHAEILSNHSIILTKHSHPALKTCFPEDKTTPLTIEHGQKIARWCAGSVEKPSGNIAKLKKELWDMTQSKHFGDKSKFLQWLVDEALIDPDGRLETMSEALIATTIKKAKAKL